MNSVKKKFVKLVQEHQNVIHKVCRVYLDNAEDRQDMFQEILLQLWRSYPDFKGQAKITTWMYRIALNTAISQIRKKKLATTPIQQDATGMDYSVVQQDEDDRQLLQSLINSLNSIEKSLILLYLEENSYEEIAEITGMTKTNVSVRLVRIKRKLAKLYKIQAI